MGLQEIFENGFRSDVFVFDLQRAFLTKCWSFANTIIISLLDLIFDGY